MARGIHAASRPANQARSIRVEVWHTSGNRSGMNAALLRRHNQSRPSLTRDNPGRGRILRRAELRPADLHPPDSRDEDEDDDADVDLVRVLLHDGPVVAQFHAAVEEE